MRRAIAAVSKFLLFVTVTITITVTVTACRNETPGGPLTEEELLNYASQEYDRELFQDPPIALGTLDGVEVVAEHLCADLCPDYTVRVIRLVVPEDSTCEAAGGMERSLLVPVAAAVTERTYCFPAILVENWDQYVK